MSFLPHENHNVYPRALSIKVKVFHWHAPRKYYISLKSKNGWVFSLTFLGEVMHVNSF
jgi:hypothetical protein